MTPEGTAFPLLRELLENPELLEPPVAVLPRIAYRGRATIIAGPDKVGKNTYLAAAAADLSRGRQHLGEKLEPGRVLWVGLEEALADAVRRFSTLAADPERIRLMAYRVPNPLEAIDAQLTDWPADLVVIDSLIEYARYLLGEAPEDGDSSGWAKVVRPLVQLTRDHDTALDAIHHTRRSDGQYRGSGEIAAAFDCLWEMKRAGRGDHPTLRRFSGRARWPVEDWSLHLDDSGVFREGEPASIDPKILADVATHPGTTRNASRERLRVDKNTHREAIDRLIANGRIVDAGRDRQSSLFCPVVEPQSDDPIRRERGEEKERG